MTPIRTLVVDDEPFARASLRILLGVDPEIEIAGECGSGEEAVEAITRLRPDLVFLDIRMPGCDGFEVLERLGAAAPPAVVFLTAYDEYALRAFEVEAIDYLLKPFDDARFARTLRRAKDTIRQRRGSAAKSGRLIVRSAGRVTFLAVPEIDWIEAADYYVCLHIAGKSHLLRRTVAEMEKDLDPGAFCRIHRSTIVNLSRIRELRIDVNGEYEAVLRDSTVLRVSRSYRHALQSLMEGAPS
jgi:two-component system, LytTR family, response regulator